jgi:hypothetical protein
MRSAGCSSAYAIAYANEVSSSLCGQQCTGDSSQTCGGAGTYQVYNTTVPHVTIDKQSNYGGASVHVSIPCAENNPRGLMTGPTWNIGQRSPTACVDWCMTYGTSYSPGGYVYPMPVRSCFSSEVRKTERNAVRGQRFCWQLSVWLHDEDRCSWLCKQLPAQSSSK